MSERMKRGFLEWFPLAVWMAVIFAFSSVPSANPAGATMPFGLYLERKGAHITEFFILTALFFRALRNVFLVDRVRIMAVSLVSALAWACLDEFHQLFVFGREGKISDVMIDFVGISLAGLFVVAWLRLGRRGASQDK